MPGSGPWESVTINNRRFPVDGENDIKVSTGGFTNEIKPNGDGTSRVVKTRKTAKVKAIPVVIDNTRGDMEFIQEVMNNPELVAFFGTEVDGTVWEGNVQISGDPEKSGKEGTMEIEVHGQLKRQGA